jgi:hypothetical protein
MSRRSHEMPPLSEKMKILDPVRKEKKYTEVAEVCNTVRYFERQKERDHIHVSLITV